MAYRSSTALADASAANVIINVPAGAAVDDIAIVGIYKENTATITTVPSGFTLKTTLNTSATARGSLYVYWKRLTAADTGTYTFSWTGSVFRGAVCGLFSGRITTGDPFDGTVGTAESTVSTATTLNVSTTPGSSGGDLVGLWTNFIEPASWTPAAGMTERQDSRTITLDSTDAIASGSTGNKSATASAAGFMKAFLGALLAAPTGTNVNAENVAFTVAAQDATSTVGGNAENVTLTITPDNPLANIQPNADVAPIAATANDASAVVRSSAEAVAFTVAGQDAAASVKPPADVAPIGFAALDATISTANQSNAPADVAPIGLAAQDATGAVAPGPAEAPVAVTGMDAQTRVAPAAQAASAAVVAGDSAAAISTNADLAGLAVSAQDATVLIGTVATAELVAFTVSAQTAALLLQPKAEAAAIGMTANDAVILTGIAVSPSEAAFSMAANNATVSVQQVLQTSGFMTTSEVPHQSMIRLTQPTAEAVGISRIGSTATVLETQGSSMGATDAV